MRYSNFDFYFKKDIFYIYSFKVHVNGFESVAYSIELTQY